MSDRSNPARHEAPDIDATALEAARAADRALAAARAFGNDRWARYLAPCRIVCVTIRSPGWPGVARRPRSAYGPKDSIRDALPEDVTEPLLVAIDRLLKALARHELDARS